MPNNEDKLLDGIFKIQEQNSEALIKLGETQTDVREVKTQMKQLNGTVKKHEQMIYGNPEKMGEGGLLFHQSAQDAKIKDNKKLITRTRTTFVAIWIGVTGVANLVFYSVKHFLGKG